MAIYHGVRVTQQATAIVTPNKADVGIPFVVGPVPLSLAEDPATPNTPVLVTSYEEAVDRLGYSDDWKKFPPCEVMYAHFKLFTAQPVIFMPVGDPIVDDKGVVSDGNTSIDDKGVVAMEGTVDEDGTVTVVHDLSASARQVAAGFQAVDECMNKFGLIPDILLAPGYSQDSEVAAIMAAKAPSILGLFRSKAIVDIDAESYTDAVERKNAGSFDENQIVCWPMVRLGSRTFHMSTICAGRMASTDIDNINVPYESPSNKRIYGDGLVTMHGKEISQTWAQANVLNNAGITTALNFMGAFVLWGNYTGAYPANTDVKDYFIPIARMFDYVGNTLIKTFWSKLDKPMNKRLLDTIMDSANIWLNGLVGMGYLLGARAVVMASENPTTDLMAGILRVHVYMTPPSPMQELDFILEYDADYVEQALLSEE